MCRTCNSINNLLSYCGLVDAKIRASDKDLPVLGKTQNLTMRPYPEGMYGFFRMFQAAQKDTLYVL